MKKIRRMALCLALLLLLPLAAGCRRQENNNLYVTVLDVGQSDCILLTLGERRMLIDTGSAVWQDALVGELAARGVDRLDVVFLTHPHEDHYGNTRLLLETHTVGALILPEMDSDELGYQILCDTAARLSVPITKMGDGDRLSLGELACEVFCAIPDDPEGNNASNVLRVCFGDCVLLFMGDAEAQAENALLARDTSWKCDFLKVGHHGSDTATTLPFVQALSPTHAAISCGRDNDYGFPHAAVLQNLSEVGCSVHRTDLEGTLRYLCDGKTVSFLE